MQGDVARLHKMADFFEPQEPQQPVEPVNNLEPESITLGDKQYTQDELNELVGLAQQAKDVEERYNTKLDKVSPEFTKSRQEIKELKEQLESLQKPQAKPASEMNEVEAQQARQAAKQLGILTKEDISELGLMRKEDVESFIREYRAGEQLVANAKSLETKYDGKDGRPAFKTQDILEYMQETGIREPEVAYKVRYEDALTSWREKKVEGARKPGLVTETQSNAGGKIPQPVKVNRDNLDRLVSEALEGTL